MFTPHQLNVGVNWELPGLPLTIAADLTWAMWSKAPSPVPHAIIQIDNSRLISDAPEGTPTKRIIDVESQSVPLGAQDILIPRIGVEYRLGAFELRCGYFYRPTPIPTQVHQTNFSDSDAHVFTLGAAWTGIDALNAFRKPITLGLGFQWTQLQTRRVDKASPGDKTGDYFIRGGVFSLGFDLQHDF
jgi:long-subunit fatty acid transport protein